MMRKFLIMAMCLMICMGITSYASADEFRTEGNVLVEYIGSGGDVVVPDGITTIGQNAFFEKRSVKSIKLPTSVTRIEKYAFFNVGYNLFAKGNTDYIGDDAKLVINIPENVTYIGDGAFKWVVASNLEIPKGVTYIGEEAFSRTRITDVKIPEGVTVISKKVFFECKELKNVTLHDKVTAINESAFESCSNLQTINFPNSLTNIGRKAFTNCSSIKEVIVPQGVKNIEGASFMWCTSLNSVVLSEGLEKIGVQSFQGCRSLNEILIPRSVTEIDFNAFTQSDNVVLLLYENSNPHKFILDFIKQYPNIEERYNKMIKVIADNVNYDKASEWAKAELEVAALYGFVTDRLKGDFKKEITREEFCEIVMKLYDKLGGESIQNVDNPFKDTKNGSVIRAFSAGIIKGSGKNTFSPKNVLTMEQLSTITINTLNKAGIENTSSWSNDIEYRLNLKDKIGPEAKVTREQAIVILKKSYDLYK